MLKVNELDVFYGGIHALNKLSFEVKEGEIVTLVGSNGAGKSTVLKSISNLIKIRGGSIIFEEEDITKTPSEKIVGKGLIHVPEGRRIFNKLTVEENLLMGAYLRKNKAEIKEDLDYVYTLFSRLKERKKQMGGTLSGGEQQMLAIGRGIMSRPKLLALDEPSMGLAPIVIDEIFSAIKGLNKKGLTVLLVEQNANIALSIADRGYVIETGSVAFDGTGSDLLVDDRVKKIYLGEE
ncbi:MAG: ABC transporter ATP-binding protein [Clostridium sp.]|uniref:ABC transporter ATP-binding protein n=1 Tax=Clostridium sp. TaxID=1506 RepID=UPI002FC7F7FC